MAILLSKETNLNIPESEDYDTIGGLVMSTLSTIPEDGKEFDLSVDGVKIHVLKIEDKRIQRVIIEKDDSTQPSEEQDHE